MRGKKLSGHPEQSFSFPPALGEHTVPILRDLLGYPPERIANLREQGAI